MSNAEIVRVFPYSKIGGNPAPIVLDAVNMSNEEMRQVAEQYGLESGFVLPPDPSSKADYQFRFFVPRHEMEMCGHATIGALWLLRKKKLLSGRSFLIDTLSGPVRAEVPEEGSISISQPKGSIKRLCQDEMDLVLSVLGLEKSDLAIPEMLNADTSRIKTLVPLKDRKMLDSLKPDFDRMEGVCSAIGSTGLYPFASGIPQGLFHARQYPAASGYPEDAATGIAASALAFGLLAWNEEILGQCVVIRQGEAMGQASEIKITFEFENAAAIGCWVQGDCLLEPISVLKKEA